MVNRQVLNGFLAVYLLGLMVFGLYDHVIMNQMDVSKAITYGAGWPFRIL
ncbi:MAG TPA: hypothetical protein VLL72_06215 [Kiloniellales bacterium]|nr:hypothetical protein [Kiloniellales bacterium]